MAIITNTAGQQFIKTPKIRNAKELVDILKQYPEHRLYFSLDGWLETDTDYDLEISEICIGKEMIDIKLMEEV